MTPEARARLLALQNAVKFKGQANPKALVGAMVAEHPESKKDMGALMKLLGDAAASVNALSVDEQKAELLRHDPSYFDAQAAAKEERRAARKELPPLKGAEQGKVVTRIPPEPSKYNHLGHALSFLINYLYARKYDGKAVLRFEDTNPERAAQEYVDAMREDVLEYLDITPSEELFVSDDMERFYEAAQQLIDEGHAYVCSCASEEMSAARRAGEPCNHRERGEEETLALWNRMKSGEEQGCVLRARIDMQHKNAVLRDPVLFRVNNHEHYRQQHKYKVWPMYDFENALEDAWCGVTHVLRSNEFETRIELHDHLRGLLGLGNPVVQQYGRFNITGATTQGREIRERIERGEVAGWDDPRLITLRALRRRGIVKEAYYELAQQCGMSKTPTNIDFSVLAAINRQLLDETANRYSFVHDPVKIVVENWPATLTEVELKLHPHKARGGRKLRLSNEFYLSKDDYETITDGRPFRLIDTCNLQYKDGAFVFLSESIDEFKALPEKHGLINYLPLVEGQELLPTKVLKVIDDELVREEGLLEPSAKDLPVGSVVQFERYGFARKDAEGEYWYAHE